MIADDRASQIADRRRSQRELFPYNRRRLQTIAEPTFAYISVSGSVKIQALSADEKIASKQHGGRCVAAFSDSINLNASSKFFIFKSKQYNI